MSFLRYAVPALAVASRVAAQSSSSSCSASTTTIQNGGDAQALASCTTFTGSIAIATGTTDNIALDGIQEIQGSLIANNVSGLSQLSADSLQTITDSFDLDGLTMLTSLNFPRLTEVGTIDWTALPELQGLSFTSAVQQVQSLTIINTQLNSLDGIDLQMADTIVITNNPYLNSITMQLGNVTQSLLLGANGKSLDAEFPNLEWAYNMTLRNCSTVSIPSLASVNGSLGFYSSGFQNLSAPNLTTVGGTLSFVSNDLTNISMPEITTVGGGFQIANNTQLQTIDGFPSLKTIGGALAFTGEFENVTLPDLGSVRGAFTLLSTQNINTTCSHFQTLAGSNGPIQGTFTCKGASPSGSSVPSGTSGSGSGSGSTSTSSAKSAANAVLIPGATGLLGVVAAIFGML